MPRSAIAMLVCLLAGGCQILSWNFTVPSQVASGAAFVVELTATTNATFGGPTAVLQLPVGFVVEGATARADGGTGGGIWRFADGGVRDDPAVLAAYTAEPGHYLASFHGAGGYPQTSGFAIVLKVYLRAAAVPNSYQLKVALGDFGTSYQHQHPAGITDFALIQGAAHVRSIQVVNALPPPPFALASTSLWNTPVQSYFAVGDLNGDHRDDLVEVVAGGNLRVHLSLPIGWVDITGNLPGATGSTASSIGDFDGDGFGDLVVASNQVFFGTGGPVWIAGPTLSPSVAWAADIAVGDVDGDGCADVAFADAYGCTVWRGRPDRTFSPFSTGLPTSTIALAGRVSIVDLDGDGAGEIITMSYSGAPYTRVWRRGPSTWSLVGTLPCSNNAWVVLDLDDDGTLEIVSANCGTAMSYRNNSLVPMAMTPIAFHHAAALDYDRDGLTDLVVADNYVPSLRLLRSVGAGGFQVVPLPASLGFRVLTGVNSSLLLRRALIVCDIDDDTFPDLAAAFMDERPLIWRNTNTGASQYGNGCSGPAHPTPQLAVQGAVAMGQTPSLWFAGAEPNGAVVVWAGTSKSAWFGAPLLPLPLAAIGAPGCSLLAEPLIVAGLVADGSGNSFLPVLLPTVAPTTPLIFFTQGAAFVPGANALQAVFSQGLALKVQ